MIKAIELAIKYYEPETLHHCLRVAGYAMEYVSSPCDYFKDDFGRTVASLEYIFKVALLHDILEDTFCTEEELRKTVGSPITDDVKILTKSKKEDYITYIERIMRSDSLYVIYTKKADMKDHLAQYETLTPSLLEKYAPVLHYFL